MRPGPGREALDPGGDVGEVTRGERQPGHGVGAMGVVAGRRQHPGGREPVHDGCHHLVERPEDDVPRGPGGQRHVDGQARGAGAARLADATRARIQRPLVGGHVQHAGVVPEDGLGPVAVVDVPVDDEDTLAACGQRRRPPPPRC